MWDSGAEGVFQGTTYWFTRWCSPLKGGRWDYHRFPLFKRQPFPKMKQLSYLLLLTIMACANREHKGDKKDSLKSDMQIIDSNSSLPSSHEIYWKGTLQAKIPVFIHLCKRHRIVQLALKRLTSGSCFIPNLLSQKQWSICPGLTWTFQSAYACIARKRFLKTHIWYCLWLLWCRRLSYTDLSRYCRTIST